MLVRRLHGRGVHGMVEIHAEALFAPGSDIQRWKAQLRERTAAYASAYAPSNKRPRWAHYGKPLKQTMRRSVATRLTEGGGFVYSAVGSTAHYSAYVDQGTSPYMAKILPPTGRGRGNLYEYSWAPPHGKGTPIGKIQVRGQKGQFFFDRALRSAMNKMAGRSRVLPGEGVSGIAASVFSMAPEPAFFGNTPFDMAFDAQLREWRLWRDEAFRNQRSFYLGTGKKLTDARRDYLNSRVRAWRTGRTARLSAKEKARRRKIRMSNSEYRKREAARVKKWREKNKGKITKKKFSHKSGLTKTQYAALNARINKRVQKEKQRFFEEHPEFRQAPNSTDIGGFWFLDARGSRKFQRYSSGLLDLIHKLNP